MLRQGADPSEAAYGDHGIAVQASCLLLDVREEISLSGPQLEIKELAATVCFQVRQGSRDVGIILIFWSDS